MNSTAWNPLLSFSGFQGSQRLRKRLQRNYIVVQTTTRHGPLPVDPRTWLSPLVAGTLASLNVVSLFHVFVYCHRAAINTSPRDVPRCIQLPASRLMAQETVGLAPGRQPRTGPASPVVHRDAARKRRNHALATTLYPQRTRCTSEVNGYLGSATTSISRSFRSPARFCSSRSCFSCRATSPARVA